MKNNSLRTLESANIGSILTTEEMGFIKGGTKKRGGGGSGSGGGHGRGGSGSGGGRGGSGGGRGHGHGHGGRKHRNGKCGW